MQRKINSSIAQIQLNLSKHKGKVITAADKTGDMSDVPNLNEKKVLLLQNWQLLKNFQVQNNK